MKNVKTDGAGTPSAMYNSPSRGRLTQFIENNYPLCLPGLWVVIFFVTAMQQLMNQTRSSVQALQTLS
nr:hypothetical protein [Virgibacillus salexigens]